MLELGDVSGMFCGKLLGDLGCDVIRVEPPGGDSLRRERPLVPWQGADISAAWLAWNTSKRSIILDLEAAAGRALLEPLLDASDAVVVAGSVAWLRQNRLAPNDLRAGREHLVAAAITPFGLEGPHAEYAISDLVAQSAGGVVYGNGDRDRPPVRISEEQTWAQVGSQTAFVVLAALHARAAGNGSGEAVDMSVHEAIVATLMTTIPSWQFGNIIPVRDALSLVGRSVLIHNVWPCKDGFVTFRLSFGQNVGMRNIRLTEWMDENGMAEDLALVPWDYLSTLELDQSEVSRWEGIVGRFFLSKTKEELYAGALDRRIMLFPVLELSDMLSNEQLASRGFFVDDMAGSPAGLRWPGAFFTANSQDDPRPSLPPAAGQDSRAILRDVAGLDDAALGRLFADGVVA